MRNRFIDSIKDQFRHDRFAKEYGRRIQHESFQVHWGSKSRVRHHKFLVVPVEQNEEFVRC